jgi:hypothetical protein
MKIIQRLRNLYKWSGLQAPDGYDFYTSEDGKIISKNLAPEKPKPMATIIKRVTVDPLEEALKDE